MEAYKETHYELTEEEMQELVAKAKLGDGNAQAELIKIFNNFLNKYLALIYHGKFDLGKSYDVRRFIALFVKDNIVRMYLVRNKLNPSGYKHVLECLNGIRYMAQRYGDEEDVRQTIDMTFLQCLMRYEPKESARGPIPFSAYLYSYFFYLLKKNVDAFLIDQLGRKTFPLISDEEAVGDGEDTDMVQGFTAPPEPSAEELLGPEMIDEYWVVGDSSMPPFDLLTVQERQLLKWRYVDGLRSSEIAVKITEHPNTVREHFNKIRARVKEIIEEDTE
jgi:hypothetical protein